MKEHEIYILYILCFNISKANVKRLQQFRWPFCICACICILHLHLIQSQVQSQRSNWDHIYHWVTPSFIPILYGVLISLSICQEHQMSVTRSTWRFGAFDNSGSRHVEGLASGVVLAVYLEHSAEIAFGGHCPSLPPHFYRWGSSVTIHTSLLLVLLLYLGLLVLESVALFYGVLWCSNSSRSRRDCPVLPQLKEIPWHLSYFGPWGASMSWDVFEWWGLLSEVPSCEGFWLSEFVGALGVVTGGWTVALLVLDLGLATTFTSYFFVGISFFLFSVALVSFLIWGWYQVVQVLTDLIGAGVLDPTSLLAQDKFSFS